jgi:hypothetical protein
MRRCGLAIVGAFALLALAGCSSTIHDTGAARLIPPIAQVGSASLGLPKDTRFTIEMPDGKRINPQPMLEPGAIFIRRAPGSRVYLAGSADGTAPVFVDDFLLIEIEDATKPSGVRQLVAGPIGKVRRNKVPIENIFPQMPVSAGIIDLTQYLPECRKTLIGAVPMDLGTIAESSAVYVVIDYPSDQWTHESCAGQ